MAQHSLAYIEAYNSACICKRYYRPIHVLPGFGNASVYKTIAGTTVNIQHRSIELNKLTVTWTRFDCFSQARELTYVYISHSSTRM